MSLNQSNVEIQHNLFQNSNDIVHRARNPKLGVVMDTYPSNQYSEGQSMTLRPVWSTELARATHETQKTQPKT